MPITDPLAYVTTHTYVNGIWCLYLILFTADVVAPVVVNCPSDQIATYELGQQGLEISWLEPHATDESGIANLISQSHQPGDIFSKGTTTVNYVFGDESGNEAMCHFDVTANVGEYSIHMIWSPF